MAVAQPRIVVGGAVALVGIALSTAPSMNGTDPLGTALTAVGVLASIVAVANLRGAAGLAAAAAVGHVAALDHPSVVVVLTTTALLSLFLAVTASSEIEGWRSPLGQVLGRHLRCGGLGLLGASAAVLVGVAPIGPGALAATMSLLGVAAGAALVILASVPRAPRQSP